MRILMIVNGDDNESNVPFVLETEHFDVTYVQSGAEAVDCTERQTFDVILLNPYLPDMRGPEVLQQLRAGKVEAPVLIVADEAGVEAMSRGFGFGADAYMATPVEREALIDILYRVQGKERDPASFIDIGDLRIDTAHRTVTVAGQRAYMSGSEYQILELLARRRGEVVTLQDMAEHLYAGIYTPEIGCIKVFVSHMRKIVTATSGGRNYVETVWGKGYKFREPEADEALWR